MVEGMKNITFSADERAIEAARARARAAGTTLNEVFRDWLADYARGRALGGDERRLGEPVAIYEEGPAAEVKSWVEEIGMTTVIAEEARIAEIARLKALEEGTTLEAELRRWLKTYAGVGRRAGETVALLREYATYGATGGRRFTRDEMNER